MMNLNGLENMGGFLGDNSINITTLPGSTLLDTFNENTTNLLGEDLEAFFLPGERNPQMNLDIFSNNHLSRDYPLCSSSLSTPGMFYTVDLLSSYQVCAKFYDNNVVICSDNADLLLLS